MHLAIDLGTSNFRASVVGTDEILSEPSVIARDKSGKVTVGHKAHAMIGRNPDVIEIVSPVEGGIIRNIEAAAEILKYCVDKLCSGYFRRRFSLTLACPTGLTQVELRALEDAGRFAGAKNITFVNSGVAAAVGVGLPVENPTGCFVVNLGGGVTEAALLSMRGVVASNAVRSGGKNMNDVIIDKVRKEHRVMIGYQMVESLKQAILNDADLQQYEVRGRSLHTGLPVSLSIPRDVLDDQLKSYCDVIVDLIGQTISQCPPELAGDIIERGIMLVGGGGNIRTLVSELLARLDAPVLAAEDPSNAVIRGLLVTSPRTSGRARDAVAGLMQLPSVPNLLKPIRDKAKGD